MAKCKSCGAAITWVRTERMKHMPLERNAEGNIVIRGGLVRFPPAEELERMNPDARYISHFATCPNARSHRR